jgi:hypothetical protein
MRFKVDVEPFASCCFGVQDSSADDRCGYPTPLVITPDLRVQEKSMIAPVPSHIDKADQDAIMQTGRDPSQAVRLNPVPPASYRAATMGLDEGHHFRVRDGLAPAVLDRVGHAHILPAAAVARCVPDREVASGDSRSLAGNLRRRLTCPVALVREFLPNQPG